MLLLSTLYSSKNYSQQKYEDDDCLLYTYSLSHTHTHTYMYVYVLFPSLSPQCSALEDGVCVCVSVLIIQDCFYCLSSIHSLSSVWLLADRRFNSAINNLGLTFDPCGCTNCLMLCRWSEALKNCRDVSGPDLP